MFEITVMLLVGRQSRVSEFTSPVSEFTSPVSEVTVTSPVGRKSRVSGAARDTACRRTPPVPPKGASGTVSEGSSTFARCRGSLHRSTIQ